jgi:hypothetical protein
MITARANEVARPRPDVVLKTLAPLGAGGGYQRRRCMRATTLGRVGERNPATVCCCLAGDRVEPEVRAHRAGGRRGCSQVANPLGALAARMEPTPNGPHKPVRRGQEQQLENRGPERRAPHTGKGARRAGFVRFSRGVSSARAGSAPRCRRRAEPESMRSSHRPQRQPRGAAHRWCTGRARHSRLPGRPPIDRH